MRDKNVIQLTQSQLDRMARNIGLTVAKQLVGEIDDDSKVFKITQKEAAEYVGVDISTIREMLRKKQIHGKLVGKRILYCKKELEPYIKN